VFAYVAGTYDAITNTGRVYINGVLDVFGPGFSVGVYPFVTTPFQIGAFGPPSGFSEAYFQGLIDEVEIYARALSESEIQAINDAGSAGKCKTSSVDTTDPAYVPESFGFRQNFPNPVRSSTTLTFVLPVAGEVSLAVFDALGRKVITLVEGVLPPGYHEATIQGRNLANGVYVVRLVPSQGQYTRTVVMAR
jgi:hypothetical protein